MMTRQSYRCELVRAMSFPVARALIEGGVVGVLAKKVFDVNDFLFATIMAAPMFANMTSPFWARLARGRSKVACVTMLQVGLALGAAMIALLPHNSWSPWLLTLLVVFCRCMHAGAITLRTAVWRHNYPRHLRGQVTSRLAFIETVIVAGVPLAGYALLDWHEWTFRILYPAGLLLATPGIWAYSRVRMRRERELLAYESQLPLATSNDPVGPAIPPEDAQPGPATGFWSVLRNDPLFRRYMLWQFVGGCAFMMTNVVVVRMITDWTEGQPSEYVISILMSTSIPLALGLVTLPLWARYFDRVHIVRFRATQSYLWIALQSLTWIAAVMHSLWWLALARVVTGFSQGGGMLAWTLGHNDFSNRRNVAQYMSVHQTLTGIRGLTAPYLGVMLYRHVTGEHVYLVALSLSLIAGIGFHLMLRQPGISPQVAPGLD
jgi:MFS family permease